MWINVLNRPDNALLEYKWVVILLTMKVQLGSYLLISWRTISDSESLVNNLRADQSSVTLKSMRVTIIGLFCLEVIWTGLFIGQQFFGIGTLSIVSDIWLLFVALLVVIIAFIGLQQPNLVFTEEENIIASQIQQSLEKPEGTIQSSSNIKYFHSSLPDSSKNLIAKQLEEQIREHRWYLDDKLTLIKLAKLTGIKGHTLSQVINQTMKVNFYKMINTYRIENAVELINTPTLNWPLERIAYESGFANRVTFSKAFKEIIGSTPSAYKKSKRQDIDIKAG
jgi:AraC-like DNA-binding protein